MDVGNSIVANTGRWSFGGDVAESFVSHISSSVPFYQQGHQLICELSDFFIRDDSILYDIGISTGALLTKLAMRHQALDGLQMIGLENQPEMVEYAKKNLSNDARAEIFFEDAVFHDYQPADLIIAYYTVQFIHPKFRQELIDKIYRSLNWGGAFICFEKTRGADARFQDIQSILYTNFKRKNDFTDSEILNKTDSLKGVLEPFSSAGNLGLLKRAGFTDIQPMFRWLCFEGMLCIK